MTTTENSKYSEAGVDIDKGNQFVKEIEQIVTSTHQRGVLAGIGGFSSHVAIDTNKYPNPVIVNSTDGVGTKLAIAQMCQKHDTIGIDLVAMCVNDLVVSGATPLCFLDYYASGRLDTEIARQVVQGIAEGCRQALCSLVGGETAEMPGLYQNQDYDLAGFVTGVVNRESIIDGSDIRPGDRIIGLASNGLHSNGYSLVRKVLFSDNSFSVDDYNSELGCNLGAELLRPTRIYVQSVLNIVKNFSVNGMVHVTGGGLVDNTPRILPKGCQAVIDTSSWKTPPIFQFIMKHGGIPIKEMYRTFNMGIGFLAIVREADTEDVRHHFEAVGETATVIGEIAGIQDDKAPKVLLHNVE